MKTHYKRDIVNRIAESLTRQPDLIQVVTGPRQVGKTTAARAVAEQWRGQTHYGGMTPL